MLRWLLATTLLLPSAAPDPGGVPETIEVTARGVVRANWFIHDPLWEVAWGEGFEVTFRANAEASVISGDGESRGHVIDRTTFSIKFQGGVVVHQAPSYLTPGAASLLVVRDDDIGGDALFLSTDVDRPLGVPLAAGGAYYQTLLDLRLAPEAELIDAPGDLPRPGTFVPAPHEARCHVMDYPFAPLQVLLDEVVIGIR